MASVELFDDWADAYDAGLRGPQSFPFTGYEDVLDAVLERSCAKPSMAILELGAGTGNLTRRFVEAGCKVWAADFSPEMLKRLSTKLPGVNYLELKVPTGLYALDKRFDQVVSSYLLHEFNLEQKLDILTRLYDYNLTGDGSITLGDIAFPDRAAHDAARKTFADAWDAGEHYWLADETLEACEQAGLKFACEQVSSCAVVMTFMRAER